MTIHKPLLLAALAAFAAGCTDGGGTTTPTEPTTEPWTVQFTFGSTSINTTDVATTQVSVSADTIVDRVSPGALPVGDLELFVTHIFVPTDQALHTEISGVSFVATRTDGSDTPNFVQGVFYLGRVLRGDQLFDLYRMQGLLLETPAMTAETFARLEVGVTVEHRRGSGTPLDTSRKTIVIEKR